MPAAAQAAKICTIQIVTDTREVADLVPQNAAKSVEARMVKFSWANLNVQGSVRHVPICTGHFRARLATVLGFNLGSEESSTDPAYSMLAVLVQTFNNFAQSL